jgi:hypothetical protein
MKFAMHGRSKDLIEKRNTALIKRYHYWTEVRRIRFDDALRILSETEFFISEDRIMAIVRANYDRLDEIRVSPFPRVRMPKIDSRQLSFFET